jgi:hypothetical protein
MQSRVPTPGSHPLEASAGLRMDRLRAVRRPQSRGYDLEGSEVQRQVPQPPVSPVAAV